MTRPGLPQYFTQSDGELIDPCDSIGAPYWRDYNGAGTLSIDTSIKKTGAGSLKLVTSTNGQRVYTTINMMCPPGTCFSFWFYHDPAQSAAQNVYAVSLILGEGTNLFVASFWRPYLVEGWNLLRAVAGSTAFATLSGTPSWSNPITVCRLQFAANTGKTATGWIDDLRAKTHITPCCMISFDDATGSVFNVAYPIMEAAGVRGTVYAIPSLIDTAGYMTTAQLQELYAAGWAIANHTYNHIIPLAGETDAKIASEIKDCTDWLIANGMPRAAYHMAYPGGAAATFAGNVVPIARSLGIKTARMTDGGNMVPGSYRLDSAMPLSVAMTQATLGTLTAAVDTARANGYAMTTYAHNLTVDGSAGSIQTSIFQAFIDYLALVRMPVLTIDEFYEGLTNPRYRSKPLTRA